jgi:hypothetical protein
MVASTLNASETVDNQLPIAEVSSGVHGSKDGKGIGDLVNMRTVRKWVQEYLKGRNDTVPPELGNAKLVSAFLFGVRSEGRYAGQSFIVAEPEVRSEWSSEKERLPWEAVRDAVWAGFDRARDRTL